MTSIVLPCSMETPFISRCWKVPNVIALATFAIVQSLMRWNQLQANKSYCKIFTSYADLNYHANVFEVIGFSTMLLVLIGILISNKFKTKNIGFIVVIGFVAFLSGISSLMKVMWNWGGICEDALGVRSNGVIWGEWLSCVPLLFYTVIAMEVKSALTSRDIGCLVNIILSIAASFAMQFQSSIIVEIFLLVVSCIFFIVSLILLRTTDKRNTTVAADSTSATSTAIWMNSEDFFAKKKNKLGLFLCFFIPAFPAVYFLSLARILSHDTTSVAYAICNVLIKIFFASIIVNTYFEAFIIMATIESVTNPIRNSLLKYIMHEVRVPLNAISMGIGLLQNSRDLTYEEKDALLMMETASEFLTDTLSDLVDFQRMDNTSIHIANQPFQLRDSLEHVQTSCQEFISEKSMNLIISVCEDVPDIIVSDLTRLEHLLKMLICHSIKLSPNNSRINISVMTFNKNRVSSKLSMRISSIIDDNNTFLLSITIQDESPPLSEAAHKLLFQPFSQILPSELRDGGGTGMSLSICQIIVNTLKGSITSSVAANSSGNMITVTLPVQSLKQDDNNAIEVLANPIPLSRHCARSTIIPSTHSSRRIGLTSSRRRKKSLQMEPMKVDDLYTIHNTSPRIRDRNPKKASINLYTSHTTENNGNSSHYASSYSSTSADINSNNNIQSKVPINDCKESHPDSSHNNSFKLELERKTSDISLNESNVTAPMNARIKSKILYCSNMVSLNALVVDDVASNRKLLSALLGIRNVQCMLAEDGLVAVDVFRSNPNLFDLIFMDYSMPRMNGVEATKIIRQEGFSQMIIAVTGNVMDDDVSAFLSAGADLVVPKPMRPKQLDELLEIARSSKEE